ncbi:MAG: hypothetical protein MZV65_00505 [Chromatiales bacterium]|nr:hypothetical protein [Chromatiales bacterium]
MMAGPASVAAATPGQHEDAGPDDRPDPEQREIQWTEHPSQLAGTDVVTGIDDLGPQQFGKTHGTS